MPLSFETQNHGSIAFGFFNIESDMLLLENYFFFADRFCKWMTALAKNSAAEAEPYICKAYHIKDARDIGDLMGAIHGIRYTGFIGRIYQLFPFPRVPEDFKQNPKGDLTQHIVEKQIEPFACVTDLPITFIGENQVSIGSYLFDQYNFHELIRYVWKGGYPEWKDGVRPPYVIQMKKQLEQSRHPFFKGVF